MGQNDKVTLYRNEGEREAIMSEISNQQANYQRLLAKQREDGGPALGVAKMPKIFKGAPVVKSQLSTSAAARKSLGYQQASSSMSVSKQHPSPKRTRVSASRYSEKIN